MKGNAKMMKEERERGKEEYEGSIRKVYKVRGGNGKKEKTEKLN